MNTIFRRLGILIKNKHVILVILGLLVIIPATLGAFQLTMDTGNETFVSADSQVYKDYERFTESFSDSVVIVLLTADGLPQLLQPDNVASMEAVENRMAADPNIVSAVSPAFFIKQAVARQTGTPNLPNNPQEILAIITDPQNGSISEDFRQVIPDNQHAFIAITLDASLSSSEQADIVETIRKTVAAADFKGIDVGITGFPTVRSDIEDLMISSMRNMLILSVILMLTILALVFSVRGSFLWRWLPLGMVLLGIIYAFGAMGILDIPITVVTMAVFPILVGLGVDYAIQFQNRYDEEARKGKPIADVIIDSVSHIGPTIGIAIIAACLGFAALFLSPVPMIRDFGLTLIIGVTSCYVLSLSFLLAILYWHDRRNSSKPEAKGKKHKSQPAQKGTGLVEKGLIRLAPWVIKNPLAIIPIALLLTAAGMIADSHIDTQTDEMKFISQDVPSIRDGNTLQSLGSGLMSVNLLVEAKDITDPAIIEWIWQTEQRINAEQSDLVAGTTSIADIVMQANNGQIPQNVEAIRQILDSTPSPIKRNFITDDFGAANIMVTAKESQTDVFEEVAQRLKDYTGEPPAGVHVTVTGMTQITVKLANALSSGREKMTLMGIVFVFAGLLLLFKFKVLRALMAIVPIALIIGWSSGVMYLWGIKYTPLTATLGALTIGIGVEFTILLMMRYYEQREKGEDPLQAMTTSMARIGRAIVASGFTVIGGFGALLIATDFPILRDFGIVTMLNVFFALVTTLVVLPPLIVWMDSWREKLSVARQFVSLHNPLDHQTNHGGQNSKP